MFRVRKKQLEELALKRFIDKVEAALLGYWLGRRVFEQDKSSTPLRAMIAHGLAVARSYGLETEQELVLFVTHMIEVNPEFHRQPHFNRLLKDRSLSFRERSDKLLQEVTAAEWNAAARMVDAHAYWSRVIGMEEGGTKHGGH